MDKYLILNNIKKYYKFNTDAEFARFLGITPQNLKQWYTRNTFDAHILATKCSDVSADWLLTGEGEMLKETNINLENNNKISDDESITISKDFYEILLAQKDVVKFQQQSIKDLQEVLKSSREQITLFQETVSIQQKSIEHLSAILSKENVAAKSTTTEPAKCVIAG